MCLCSSVLNQIERAASVKVTDSITLNVAFRKPLLIPQRVDFRVSSLKEKKQDSADDDADATTVQFAVSQKGKDSIY